MEKLALLQLLNLMPSGVSVVELVALCLSFTFAQPEGKSALNWCEI
ncbi:hypothetical protein ORJ00_04465 [Rheinheimera baltica]|nr:hypothetical protein [Rheinheimera baltica]MDP5141989.1 hypothetical protein [Rheinheimera baltica]